MELFSGGESMSQRLGTTCEFPAGLSPSCVTCRRPTSGIRVNFEDGRLKIFPLPCASLFERGKVVQYFLREKLLLFGLRSNRQGQGMLWTGVK